MVQWCLWCQEHSAAYEETDCNPKNAHARIKDATSLSLVVLWKHRVEKSPVEQQNSVAERWKMLCNYSHNSSRRMHRGWCTYWCSHCGGMSGIGTLGCNVHRNLYGSSMKFCVALQDTGSRLTTFCMADIRSTNLTWDHRLNSDCVCWNKGAASFLPENSKHKAYQEPQSRNQDMLCTHVCFVLHCQYSMATRGFWEL